MVICNNAIIIFQLQIRAAEYQLPFQWDTEGEMDSYQENISRDRVIQLKNSCFG